ncbi:MAG: hypothetical protein ABSG22_04420 [Sedimentisphaerales bacterium]|jgi:hypothetical protein
MKSVLPVPSVVEWIQPSAGKSLLAMGDNVVRQTSNGHSQIQVSRNDRCEYAFPADKTA